MSTQPPNPQLMSRMNVAMAVAQPKGKPTSKANSTPKGKMQMHRRSRTGLLDSSLSFRSCFLVVASSNSSCTNRALQVATHVDYGERSATRVRPRVRHANILVSGVSTRDQFGGATMSKGGCRKTISK